MIRNLLALARDKWAEIRSQKFKHLVMRPLWKKQFLLLRCLSFLPWGGGPSCGGHGGRSLDQKRRLCPCFWCLDCGLADPAMMDVEPSAQSLGSRVGDGFGGRGWQGNFGFSFLLSGHVPTGCLTTPGWLPCRCSIGAPNLMAPSYCRMSPSRLVGGLL